MSSYITTSVKITSTLVSLSVNKLTVAMFILFTEQRYKLHVHCPPQQNGYLSKHQLITSVFFTVDKIHTYYNISIIPYVSLPKYTHTITSASYHVCLSQNTHVLNISIIPCVCLSQNTHILNISIIPYVSQNLWCKP